MNSTIKFVYKLPRVFLGMRVSSGNVWNVWNVW